MNYVSHNAEVVDVIHVRHTGCPLYPAPIGVLSPARELHGVDGVIVQYEGYCECGAWVTIEAKNVRETYPKASPDSEGR